MKLKQRVERLMMKEKLKKTMKERSSNRELKVAVFTAKYIVLFWPRSSNRELKGYPASLESNHASPPEAQTES